MTREDIIRMAREAGGIDFTNNNAWGVTTWLGTGTPEFLERFAALVAAAEREACAKFCEENQVFRGPKGSGFLPFCKETLGMHEGMEYAAEIRRRGEVKP